MVETITPVVHGGRSGKWAGRVALHVLGATLAAGLFGVALGGLGGILGAPWRGGALVVAAVALLYAAREALGLRVPVPQARRQVPAWWRSFFPGPVFSFLYGVGLGIGFFTFLSHGTLVAVTAAAVAGGKPLVGLLAMAPFGLARGLSVLAASGARSEQDGALLVGRLARVAGSGRLRALNGVALLGVAATAALAPRSIEGRALATGFLALAFGWAAAAKVRAPRAWSASLARYRLPTAVERAVLVAVPSAEGAVFLLAVLGLGRSAGALALALLVAFSGAVLWARRVSGDRLACGCFGGGGTRDYRALLARNAALALLAWTVAAHTHDASWVRAPQPGETVPAILAAAGVAAAGLTLAAGLRVLRGGRP